MLTDGMKLKLKDIACRLSESSELLPGEEDFLVGMAEYDNEANKILELALSAKIHNGVSGE